MKFTSTIELKEAKEIATLALQKAKDDGGLPLSIAVVDASGEMLMAVRMDGASADSFGIAANKAKTAVRTRQDTVEIAHVLDADGKRILGPATGHRADDSRRTVNPTFVSWAGGVTLEKRLPDGVIGALAVSGRAELDDHRFADEVRDEWYRGLKSSEE